MVKWYWLVVALVLGVAGAYLWAHFSAASTIAKLDAEYQSTKGQLDSSTAIVKKLTDELADKDSQLSNLGSQLQRANANAAGLSRTNSQLAGQLAELKRAIGAGATGLEDDEATVVRLTGLLETSLSVVGGLQGGH